MFLYLMYLVWPPPKRVCRDKKEGGRAEGRKGGRKEERKTGKEDRREGHQFDSA
jgi:hypothetical protein